MQQTFWTVIVSALLIVGAHAASDQPVSAPSDVIHVDVKTSNAAGLLRSMTDFAGLPLVSAVPPDEEQLEFQGQYPSWPALLEALSTRLQMTAIAQNKLLVLRPACSRLPASPPGPASAEKLSLNFEHLPLSNLFKILKVEPRITPEDQSIIERTGLTLRLRDVTTGDLLQAVATAIGFQWAGDAETGWRFQRAGSSDCAFSWVRPDRDRGAQFWMGRKDKSCPHRNPPSADNTRLCDSLELFSLHTLRPVGYANWRGRFVALVERPDGLLDPTRVGDYLGRDYGKVMKIDAKGLDVREIIQDDEGTWIEKAQIIRFGEYPKPTQPVRYRRIFIGQDSPQALYEKELQSVFMFSQQWARAMDICARHHPDVSRGQTEALSRWRDRNAKELKDISRHVKAFVELVAADYDVPKGLIEKIMQDNVARDVEGSFKITGELSSTSVRALCAAQMGWLDDQRNDLTQRFPQALKVMRQCTELGTCLRLED
jgi:hypothetical protein